MLLFVFALLGLMGAFAYCLTADERVRVMKAVVTVLEGDPKSEPLVGRLRARTSRTLVTPALIALNAAMLFPVLWDPAASGTTESLVELGASFGPRTTNGEWWRLGKSIFLHAGLLHFVVMAGGLFQIGLVAERLVGPVAFVSVYFAAGVVANLASISQSPLTASIGASGAVFGIYGLLFSTSVWALLEDSPLRISRTTLTRVAPAAGIFILYSAVTNHLSLTAELVGLVVGVVGGAILAKGIGERKPSYRRCAATAAAAMVFFVAGASRFRGIDDVRPELGRVVAVEQRTAESYDEAVERFRKGRLRAEDLALMIDKAIVPELRAADARLKAFDRVPAEYQALVASAEEYIRLRHDSWRIRADALRQMGQLVARKVKDTNTQAVTLALKQAELTERASLESLEKIRPVAQ